MSMFGKKPAADEFGLNHEPLKAKPESKVNNPTKNSADIWIDDGGKEVLYTIKPDSLEKLRSTRSPVLLGEYYGEKVFAAIFTEDELKYILPSGD